MPATQASPATDDGAVDQEDQQSPSVNDYLELALEAARDQGMSTSELMGIFFYYAHSIAESYREDVIDSQRQGG